MTVRPPAVAGTFYPADPERLRADVRALVGTGLVARPALAVMVPHAGYVYSGPVAGAVYGSVEVSDSVILLHFDHRRAGDQWAIWRRGAWRTPLGEMAIDGPLADAVAAGCGGLTSDPPHQGREHSGEVQVPFLQVRNPRARLVPVALSCGMEAADRLTAFGAELAAVPAAAGALVVASTDLNHFEPEAPTRRKDAAVIEAIVELDAGAMVEAIEEHDVSMCGFAPVLAMIGYARARGATAARLVRYDTSATTSGDVESVVGYGGIVVDYVER